MIAQRGFALLVSLVVLLALTILAVSSINLTQVDMRISGNIQMQQEAEALAADFIEELLGDYGNFRRIDGDETEAQSFAAAFLAARGVGDEVELQYTLQCMEQRPQAGYSELIDDDVGVEIAYWHARAQVLNASTNARMAIAQGVRMAMLAANPDCVSVGSSDDDEPEPTEES
ncbi:hypothetical protein HUS23_03675 [Ectothiorhodospiraceae bacterium 2226]|nr:hypothetical protein HUS23_03675 [Ectothiorhodospiraceae bacterium 2226]